MKINKTSLSFKILKALERAIDEDILQVFSYSAQLRYLRSLSDLSGANNDYLKKSIKRFKERGLLEFGSNKEGEIAVKLTKAGREVIGTNERWDGKFRVIIWDIPEKNRRLRDLLRRKLREWEFKSVQKSVWVSKRNITKQLRGLIDELEMGKWVTVIETDDPILSDINFHDRGR